MVRRVMYHHCRLSASTSRESIIVFCGRTRTHEPLTFCCSSLFDHQAGGGTRRQDLLFYSRLSSSVSSLPRLTLESCTGTGYSSLTVGRILELICGDELERRQPGCTNDSMDFSMATRQRCETCTRKYTNVLQSTRRHQKEKSHWSISNNGCFLRLVCLSRRRRLPSTYLN